MLLNITYTTPAAPPRDTIFAKLKKNHPQTVLVFIDGETASVQGVDIETAVALGIPTSLPVEKAKHLQRRFIARGRSATLVDLNEGPTPRPVYNRGTLPAPGLPVTLKDA